MSSIMTKQEFYCNFMNLLSKELNIKSYFNSSKLLEFGIEPITGNVLGECHTWKDGTPVVIKYRKNREREMLGTLIHEYAHAILHPKNDKLSKAIKEMEAETVAQNVLKYFSITDVSVNYIDEQIKKCSESELEDYRKTNREVEIKDLSKRIINILETKKTIIKKISNESSKPKSKKTQYKYGVMCPCCNKIIAKYERMAKIIKNNGKGYYCVDCKRDKTLDRLIIIHY